MYHRLLRYVVILGLVFKALAITSCRHGPSAETDFYSIRDAKDWQNPFLVIEDAGVYIVLPDLRVHVSMDKLNEFLSQLPDRYWPNGKIVAIIEGGGPSGNGDDELIRRNKAEAKQILDSMGIRIKWWNLSKGNG